MKSYNRVNKGEEKTTMSCNILSWNMKGSRDQGKTAILRRKVRKHRPRVVALQESKTEVVTEKLIKHLWGNRSCEWAYITSQGKSGGLISIRDTDKIELVSKLEGAFSLSLEFKNIGEHETWVQTNVYGPTNYDDKEDFWGELAAIGGGGTDHGVYAGTSMSQSHLRIG